MITNQTIAERFHYHPDHINRIVLSYTGMTLKQYIINLRIRRAVDLLINTDADISSIASSIGYDKYLLLL
jgi:AraC-like DNA-binding protein